MSVAQGVGAVVGGVIGFATGGPAGALRGIGYGVAIAGALDPADLPGYDGPRLSDPSEQTSGFGVGLHYPNGTTRIPGHVVWIENNTRKTVVTKEETGGKGGPSQTSTTYSYTGTFMVFLCDRPIKAIGRVWDSRGLLLNTGATDVDTAMATSDIFPLAHLYNSDNVDQLKAALQVSPTPGPKGEIRLYPGFDDQMPDPRMEAALGVGNCSAYRNCSFLMFYDWPLPQEYGQSIKGAQISAEVIVDGADGAAVFLNEVRVDAPAGFVDPRCQYLTPDLSRVYFAESGWGVSPSNQFRVLDVGPWGTERGDPVYLGFAYGRNHDGRGITDTQIGPIGFQNNGAYISSFPGDIKIYSGKFSRRGELGYGVWFGYSINPSNVLYVGFEEDNTYDSLALSSVPVEIAMDDDGNGIVLYADRIEIYDQSLSLTRTIDITSSLASEFVITVGYVWMVYANGIIYVGREGGNYPDSIYTIDLDTETVGNEITLRDLNTGAYPGTALLLSASNFNVSGSLLTRFVVFSIGGPCDALVEHFRLPTPGTGGQDLAAVVRERIEQSELIQPSDIDVSDLSGTVRGFNTQGVGSIRSQIEPLMLGYQFDLIQDGYQVKAVMRGNASVLTVDPDDLDARPYGAAPGDALISSREMDTQLPSVVIVRHKDSARDYDINEQQYEADPSSASVNKKEFNLPLVFTPDETAGIAEIIGVRTWLERTPYNFSLPPTYLSVQPADVLTLPMDYGTLELFIRRVNSTVDGRVECEAVLNDTALYTPNAVGSSGNNTSATTVSFGGNSKFIPLDIPPIKDEYNTYGYAGAMAGYSSSWPGATLYRSTDTGQTWQPVQSFSGQVVSGTVETPLSQDDGYVINYTDQLTVKFFSSDMSISSITVAQMLSGMNWAAYGVDGRWEIILFANATNNGDGTWTLDTILRGAKGTEHNTGLHQEYDYFVFLSDADMAFINSDINNIGVERLLRGVTFGKDFDSVSNQAYTYLGENLKPRSPVKLYGYKSGADWVLGGKRRTRLQGSYFTNGLAVPLGEATEAYEFDIMNGSTVVRTISASTEEITYPEADQITDFGSEQLTLTFRMVQISATVGRGVVSEETV
jgi:hypothetical protein